MPTVSEKRKEFRRLHQSGCFVIPNPWDVGTTRYLENAGFKALATTSAGFAWSRGSATGRCPAISCWRTSPRSRPLLTSP